MLYPELSNTLIGSFYEVHKAIGPGLLEASYHNALFLNLCKKGVNVKYQFPLPVFYEGDQVGEYFADLLVDSKIIIEVKSVKAFSRAHVSQVINYLHISKCRLGLLVNFSNPSVEFNSPGTLTPGLLIIKFIILLLFCNYNLCR